MTKKQKCLYLGTVRAYLPQFALYCLLRAEFFDSALKIFCPKCSTTKNLFPDFDQPLYSPPSSPPSPHPTPRRPCPLQLHRHLYQLSALIPRAHHASFAAVLYAWCTHPLLVRIASQFRLCPHRVPTIPSALEGPKKLLNVFGVCKEQTRRQNIRLSSVARQTEAPARCCAY